ncbi:MAG: hypothetical protein ABIR65_01205 [Pseudolysinimonas sp.]
MPRNPPSRAARLIHEAATLDQDDAGDVYPTLGAAAAIARVQSIATEHGDRPVLAALAELGAVGAVAEYERARNPVRMGRPPRGGGPTRQLTIRATEDEEAAWLEAAGSQPWAAWARDALNASIGRK